MRGVPEKIRRHAITATRLTGAVTEEVTGASQAPGSIINQGLAFDGDTDGQLLEPAQEVSNVWWLEQAAMLGRHDLNIECTYPTDPVVFSGIGGHPALVKFFHFRTVPLHAVYPQRGSGFFEGGTDVTAHQNAGFSIPYMKIT